MNNVKRWTIVLGSLAMASVWNNTVFAQTTATQSASHSSQQQGEITRLSTDVRNAMNSVDDARYEIFQGDIANAINSVEKGQALLNNSQTDWSKYYSQHKKAPRSDDHYVVFGSHITLAEDFVASPEKSKAVATANQHLKKGERKAAVETLREAGVQIREVQDLLPLKEGQQDLNKAAQLLKEGKYYEASMMLKALDDLVITDSNTVSS